MFKLINTKLKNISFVKELFNKNIYAYKAIKKRFNQNLKISKQ